MQSVWMNVDAERDYDFDDSQVWRIWIVLVRSFVFRFNASQQTALVWNIKTLNLDMQLHSDHERSLTGKETFSQLSDYS